MVTSDNVFLERRGRNEPQKKEFLPLPKNPLSRDGSPFEEVIFIPWVFGGQYVHDKIWRLARADYRSLCSVGTTEANYLFLLSLISVWLDPNTHFPPNNHSDTEDPGREFLFSRNNKFGIKVWFSDRKRDKGRRKDWSVSRLEPSTLLVADM